MLNLDRDSSSHTERTLSLLKGARNVVMVCWNCGKWGHNERECTAAKKEDNSKKGKKAKGKRAAKEEHEDTHEDVPGYYNHYEGKAKRKPAHIIEVDHNDCLFCLSSTSSNNESSVGFYMSIVLDNASALIENSTTMKPKCKGKVKFVVEDSVTKLKVPVIVEALFVDGTTNILSQRLLFVENGFKSQTSDYQETNTLADPVLKCNWKFDMVGGLYQSVVEILHASRTLAVLPISAQSSSTIKDMEAKQLVTGIKLTRDQRRVKENCLNCDMAKMKRMSFKKTKPRRATVAFQKVFIDLAFIQDETIGGNTMYLHLIDESTWFQWIFLQMTKDETVDRLREFRYSGKADYDKVVKIYRSDQRTEFQNAEVAEQLRGNAEVAEQLRGESIQIFSHPHTPVEACLIEKAHGKLMNKVRAVLYSSGMPELLWGEAAAYVIHTINRTSRKGNVRS
ncbi:hypothetical protein PHMEG_00026750 [Phytophthora megakarya]|uniref:CCHC-type domain-containing protein n=1 Tax=Phytophthora megakarya TaxID=4795 RepID=A0A225VBG0_9STRA|nr:hypothetical protein PHMEG_00026750 [Phytophthora megakarya]